MILDKVPKEKIIFEKDEFYWYDNIPVTYLAGVRLMIDDKTPLRAAKVKVFARDIEWKCAPSYPVQISPLGRGKESKYGWMHTPANELGLVLFQTVNELNANKQITGTSIDNADVFILNKEIDIKVNVNDGRTPEGYSDNEGSFDILISVLK